MNFKEIFSKFAQRAVKLVQMATDTSIYVFFSTKNIASHEIFNHSCFEEKGNCRFQLWLKNT